MNSPWAEGLQEDVLWCGFSTGHRSPGYIHWLWCGGLQWIWRCTSCFPQLWRRLSLLLFPSPALFAPTMLFWRHHQPGCWAGLQPVCRAHVAGLAWGSPSPPPTASPSHRAMGTHPTHARKEVSRASLGNEARIAALGELGQQAG